MTEFVTSKPHIGTNGSKSNDVKDKAGQVAQSAKEAGGSVASKAKEQGKGVATEASRQTRQLYQQAQSEVIDQTGKQQGRAASGLRSLADEVARMADSGGDSGPATQAARQVSNRLGQAAEWLQDREPMQVLEEVKTYARRHPGVFLLGAAALGVFAGRFTKNMMQDSGGDSGGSSGAPISENAPSWPPADAPTTVTTVAPEAGLLGEPADIGLEGQVRP